MIKKYNQYIRESLLTKLEGPTEEELWNNLLNKYNNYEDIIFAAARANYVEGVKKSLEIINKEGNSGLNFPNLLLNDTIANGSIDVLKYLIEEEGASIDGYYGYNLENAASNNEPEIIKYLLSKGADVNINKSGPLWRAMSKGYVECAKELLKGGAKLEPYMVGVVDKKNKPMLDLLNKYIVKESLLDKLKGPTDEEIRNFINGIKDNNEKLSQAIKHNFFDMVEDIVRNNNYNEEIALINSLYFDNNKITYYLLKNNKILNSDNINALNIVLRQASEFGNLELVIYSIKNGADINSGRSYALRYAIMGGYIDIAKYLIKHGADVELANSFIIKYKKFDDSKILLQLANANESLLNKLEGPTEEEIIENFKDNPSELLKYSCEYGYLSGLKIALKYINIHEKDDYPLRRAAAYNQLEIVKYLIEQGANINKSNALIWSIRNKNYEIVKYLIEQGADVNLIDYNLLYAIKFDNLILFNYIENLRK